MNFDFGWFLTVPGMLITGGVLLLIIALIILIATNKKKKDDMDEIDSSNSLGVEQPMMEQPSVDPGAGMATDFSNVAPVGDMNMQPVETPMEAESIMNIPSPISTEQPVEAPVEVDMNAVEQMNVAPVDGVVSGQPVEAIMPEASVTPEVPSMDVAAAGAAVTPEFAPVDNTVMPAAPAMPAVEPVVANDTLVTPEIPVVETPTVAPVADTPIVEAPVMPAVEPVVDTPVVTPTVEPVINTPAVTPAVEPIVETPVVTPTVEPVAEAPTVVEPITETLVTPATEPVTMAATEPVIYGGANPTVSNINIEPQQTHQIYGGANPLENTQSIPISNIAGPNAQVQTPVVETPAVAPAVEPIQVQNIQQ